MNENMTDYAFRTRIDLPFEAAVEEVTAALKGEGFGVLTEVDVKATLKNKIDINFRKYVILGACNPALAYRALNIELEVGLLLPCNIIVYEAEGQSGSIVSIVDPISMMGSMINPDLDAVAREARSRLLRVLEALE